MQEIYAVVPPSDIVERSASDIAHGDVLGMEFPL